MVDYRLSLRYTITILVLLMWLCNYHICNYFYKDELIRWWDLKQSIYNLCIVLALNISSRLLTPLFKILIDFITGLMLSSIIDRMWFETRTYDKSDIIMLTINIIYTSYNLMKCWKIWHKKRKKNY